MLSPYSDSNEVGATSVECLQLSFEENVVRLTGFNCSNALLKLKVVDGVSMVINRSVLNSHWPAHEKGHGVLPPDTTMGL